MTPKDVLDAGLTGVLAAGVWLLWVRLNTVTDRLFTLLEQGAAERQAIANSVGMTSQDLSAAAAEIRARRAKK